MMWQMYNNIHKAVTQFQKKIYIKVWKGEGPQKERKKKQSEKGATWPLLCSIIITDVTHACSFSPLLRNNVKTWGYHKGKIKHHKKGGKGHVPHKQRQMKESPKIANVDDGKEMKAK